jgi:putative addiction module component (TIGR02574 family)
MASPALSALLKLPADERAELAMALWESLSPALREAALQLTPELAAELDSRWQEHLEHPDAAVPWETVRERLLGRASFPDRPVDC